MPANDKHNFDVEINGKRVIVTKGFGDHNRDVIEIIGEEAAYNSVS